MGEGEPKRQVTFLDREGYKEIPRTGLSAELVRALEQGNVDAILRVLDVINALLTKYSYPMFDERGGPSAEAERKDMETFLRGVRSGREARDIVHLFSGASRLCIDYVPGSGFTVSLTDQSSAEVKKLWEAIQ